MFTLSTLTIFAASLVAVVAFPNFYIDRENKCHAEEGKSAMAGPINFQTTSAAAFDLGSNEYVAGASYTITISNLPGTFMVAADQGTWTPGGGDNFCDGDGETGLWQKFTELTSHTSTWTAPAAGSGSVNMFYSMAPGFGIVASFGTVLEEQKQEGSTSTTEQPTTSTEELTTSTEQPTTSTEQPTTSTEQPTTTEPVTSTSERPTPPDLDGTHAEVFCDMFFNVCSAFNTYYTTKQDCVSAYEATPAGDISDTTGNTQKCRDYHLGVAPTFPSLHCKHAAGEAICVADTTLDTTVTTITTEEPTTSQVPTTTTDVVTTPTTPTTYQIGEVLEGEAFCTMFDDECGGINPYDSELECLADYYYTPEGTPLDVSGNSQGCRTYHLMAAKTISASVHCPHAKGGGPCESHTDPVDFADAVDFCDDYSRFCVGFDSYDGMPPIQCVLDFMATPKGTKDDVVGNTRDCRRYHVVAAFVLNDPEFHCPHAAGESVCVSDATFDTTSDVPETTTDEPVITAEQFCDEFFNVCASFNPYSTREECKTEFKATDEGTTSDYEGDTQGCRVYHLGIAKIDSASDHCPHAAGEAVCVGDAETLLTPFEFCAKYFTTCPNLLNSFSSLTECLASYAYTPEGQDGDVSGNTKFCKVYHLKAAETDAQIHCNHAGGDNVCVGGESSPDITVAVDFCTQFEQTCGNVFYPSAFDCVVDIMTTPAGNNGDVTGDSVACRAYHVDVAIEQNDPTTHCPHAAGQAVCVDPGQVFCADFMNTCKDFNTYSSFEECVADYASTRAGDVKDTVGDTQGCRDYHLGLAQTVPVVHCKHAAGKQLCVDAIPAFCTLFQEVCRDYDNKYASLEECATDFNSVPEGQDTDTSGNTVGCRSYHLTAAGSNPAFHCQHARGDAICVAPATTPDTTTTEVTDPDECPSNCGKVGNGGGTCEVIEGEKKCTSCNTGKKLLAHGTCQASVSCKKNTIRVGPLATQSCECSKRNCHACVLFPTGETCKTCKNNWYLQNEECVKGADCESKYTRDGIKPFGRRCVLPYTCKNNKVVGNQARGCTCPADDLSKTDCITCEHRAGEVGQHCMKCTNKKHLHNNRCVDDCDGLEGVIAYSPPGKKGRSCRAPFQCTNGVDEDNNACACPLEMGKDCAVCDWGIDGNVCQQCIGRRVLYQGKCIRRCPGGTQEVGDADVGRECKAP